MSTLRFMNNRPVRVGALLSCACAMAVAQEPVDVPAVMIPGSCQTLNFNRASLTAPIRVDLAAQVDASGNAVSVVPLAEVSNKALLDAVTASVMSCKFLPAVRQGIPGAGTARLLYQFTAAPSAAPLARRPGIANINECAPTAADYPAASRRLNETGTTRISFTVGPQGHLSAFGVVRSSGFLRLDYTALLKLAGCTFKPATDIDGKPASATFEVEYIWKLE